MESVLRFSQMDIVLQELPGEISICFSFTGCPLRCKGCHSPFLWKGSNGTKLTAKLYIDILSRYQGFATAVIFMGGEWSERHLEMLLITAKSMGYKTCLYTGLTTVSRALLSNLDYIKTGPYVEELGGLSSKTTNQRMYEVATNRVMNHLFQNSNHG